MTNNESERELVLQTLRTWMAFRQADKACLTNLINNLEKKNWVIRKEGPSDRRNRLIFLTPQGEELALTVKPLINDIYAQTGTEMEASRITECIEDLKRLHEVLNEI